MKIKKIILLTMIVCVVLTLVSCKKNESKECDHEWAAATCTEPMMCTVCHETAGDPIGHNGGNATCTAKATCEVCGSEYGLLNSENHSGSACWAITADTHQQVYDCCGEELTNAENHTKVNGVCTICGFKSGIGVSGVEMSADGSIAYVFISIADNPGILGLEMSVSFDATALTLKSAKSGSAMNGLVFTASDDISKGGKFLWDGIEASKDDGEVLVLAFDISEAPAGNYDILIGILAYDSDLNSSSSKIENCIISVK